MTTTDRTFRSLTGALTAAYGAAVCARPSVLLNPAALVANKQNLRLARVLGVRDVLSGTSLLVAPPQSAASAVTVRVLADVSDVVLFGVRCPASAKLKAVSVATGWALICGLGHPSIGRLAKKARA